MYWGLGFVNCWGVILIKIVGPGGQISSNLVKNGGPGGGLHIEGGGQKNPKFGVFLTIFDENWVPIGVYTL